MGHQNTDLLEGGGGTEWEGREGERGKECYQKMGPGKGECVGSKGEKREGRRGWEW